MKMTLSGDYYHGNFISPAHLGEDELITKTCPGDTSQLLWSSKVDYASIDKVIESSQIGYETFRKTALSERIELLKKYQEIVLGRKDDIAMAIALETGKPLWESLTEASAIAAKVDVTINDSLKRIETKTINNILPNIDGHTVYKPLGPCLIIGPFNFPCHLANGQILSALIAGNSIIFKPSEKTIYSSQLLIECFHAAGFPKGVINFINGTVHTTQSILKHPSIKGIFFTGSYAVGKKILETVGTDVTKLVALEMGGKNTTILHEDTDIDHALPEVLRACFLSTGQRCTSTSVILVHKSIEQEFIKRFKDLTERIIYDHPTLAAVEPFMGPLIDAAAKEKYLQSISLGEKSGAEALLAHTEQELKFKGHYVNPTIHYLQKTDKSNPFTQEEIFGPSVCFIPYTDIEHAIEMANISDYGLAAAVFTKDQGIYQLALRDIQAGIINLNRSTVGASSRLPFGGVGQSGNFHPAAVSMIDATVHAVASLETFDMSSKIEGIKGLKV